MGLTILSYQTVQREKEAHTYNYIYLLKQNIFWRAKIVTLVIYSFVANSLVAILTIILEHIIYDSENIITGPVLLTSLILWLTTLFIIPLSLLISQLTMPILSVITNLIGLVAAAFTIKKAYWYLNPWSWSLRLITPIIKTNPNGTLMQKGDLLDTPTIIPPSLCLATIVFFILYASVPLILSRTRGKID
ncbi:hypothetical protein ACNAN0_09360 [Agrilactobacillus fermenti]|uniref:hypothetical protein n=1 Tax=Agrilactobacillus fermenti TaxID=2586909 RepID=UPI003A5C66A6